MIIKFDGDYAFLSNFYNFSIEYNSLVFNSLEAAYQAQKAFDSRIQKCFTYLTPGLAKRLGKNIKIRNDWEGVKDSIMLDLLRIKFKNSPLKEKLIATKEEKLIEGNTWAICIGVLVLVMMEIIMEKIS